VIIPIGHDKGRRRLPVVTLAILSLCTLVQVHRTVFAPAEEEIFKKLYTREEYVHILEHRLDEAGIEYDVKRIDARDYGGIDDSLVPEIQLLDREIKELKKQDLALRFGWAPKDGLTLNLLLCAFVHAGWLHLIGNMLFLWLSGAAIEDRWGHLAFGLFYAVGAVAASLTYGMWNKGSEIVLVGASGAVAACMGAFLILYARVKIRFFWWWYFRTGTFEARALYALPIWFAEELLYSYFEAHGLKGVAHSAHVGGFIFGMAAAAALKYSGFEEKHLVSFEEQAEDWVSKNPELDEGLRYERSGQKSAALAAFKTVLGREPNHAMARSHALLLALELSELELARQLASGGVADLAKDGRVDELPMVFKKLEAAGLAGDLNDRSLAEVARVCLAQEPYAALGVQMVRRLLDAPVLSPLLPGLVWRVAEVQANAGRGDLAARALQIIVERFPMDPFADRARVKLAEAAAGAGAGAGTG